MRAQQAGQFYFDVFKPDPSVSGAYILMSKTLISPPGPGIHIHVMQNLTQVEPDWVIGYHFASSAVPDVIYEIRSSEQMSGMPYLKNY